MKDLLSYFTREPNKISSSPSSSQNSLKKQESEDPQFPKPNKPSGSLLLKTPIPEKLAEIPPQAPKPSKLSSAIPKTPGPAKPPTIHNKTPMPNKQAQSERSIPNSAPVKQASHNSFEESDYDLPQFLKKESIQDIERRRPADPDYDPTTLYVPPNEKFTPAMSQYWDIKKHHFDKILLFKLGKFYELFYLDAITVQPILELRWMGDEKKRMHIGFPEKTLEKYASILVSHGLKLVVVEQTETTLKNRIKKTGKVVGREVTEVLSKSTFSAHYMEESHEPSYLVSVVEVQDVVGYCLADFSISEIIVGESDIETFLNIVAKTRPVEVVYNSVFLSNTLLKMFKNLPLPPVLSQLRNHDLWNPTKIDEYLPSKFSDLLSTLPKATTIRSLTGLLSFMKESLIYHKIIPGIKINKIDSNSFGTSFMILDRQALEHLEILESTIGKQKSVQGSLYEFVNKCKTPFGKRLLKKWILAPLMDAKGINKRLDAIEELMNNPDAVRCFVSYTERTNDLERTLARLASLSAKSQSKAVYFENVSSKQILNLIGFLKQMKQLENLMCSLESCSLESLALQQICKFTEEGGQFPRLDRICDKILSNIDQDCEENPVPVNGYCESYDLVSVGVKSIKGKLEEELVKERKLFDNNPEIKFVDSKFRYELEVPAYLIKKSKPAHYEETSARSGYQRYYTKNIKKLADELEIEEDKLKNELRPFLLLILSEFMEYHDIWKKAIELVAEFDCLLSLSKVSMGQTFPMTRPILTENPSELSIKDLHHPILASRVQSFIPNDLSFTSETTAFVLTGPNMGGKSTVLRKVCLAVILGQLGCYVPASYFEFSPVDRIFTRLGANDSLLEGKSTFAVEMEEAGKFFKYGSNRSLVIMDELGRGTSTQDGSAIALAVLRRLAETKTKTLFTTHYHMLIEDIKKIKGVTLVHMDSIIDQNTKNVIFLYKLKKGECPKSYGINVARMAGLPSGVLGVAERVARVVEEKQAKILEEKRKYNG